MLVEIDERPAGALHKSGKLLLFVRQQGPLQVFEFPARHPLQVQDALLRVRDIDNEFALVVSPLAVVVRQHGQLEQLVAQFRGLISQRHALEILVGGEAYLSAAQGAAVLAELDREGLRLSTVFAADGGLDFELPVHRRALRILDFLQEKILFRLLGC